MDSSKQPTKSNKDPVSVGIIWAQRSAFIGAAFGVMVSNGGRITFILAPLLALASGVIAFILGWIYGKLFGNQNATLVKADQKAVEDKTRDEFMNSEWAKISHEEKKPHKLFGSNVKSENIDVESVDSGGYPVNQNKAENDSRYSYKNARLAIEYRSEAKSAFESLHDFPKEFKIKFLDLLEENPHGPVGAYMDHVKKEYNSWLNTYDNKNIALNEARKLGPQAEKEFKKIVEVLGNSVEPNEVISRIKEKIVTIPNDSREILDVLEGAYHIDSTRRLMNHFGIRYKNGAYLYKGIRYKRFVNAAIAADKDKLDILDAMN